MVKRITVTGNQNSVEFLLNLELNPDGRETQPQRSRQKQWPLALSDTAEIQA